MTVALEALSASGKRGGGEILRCAAVDRAARCDASSIYTTRT